MMTELRGVDSNFDVNLKDIVTGRELKEIGSGHIDANGEKIKV